MLLTKSIFSHAIVCVYVSVYIYRSSRDATGLSLLLAEPTGVRTAATTSTTAGGAMSWVVRRALVRLAAHPHASFSWAAIWSGSLPRDPTPGVTATPSSSAVLGYGDSGMEGGGELASVGLESVILLRVEVLVLGALAASAHASGAAVEDDASERGELFFYRVRDSLEHTTRRLQRVAERCAALVSFEVCHHKHFLIYRAD